MAKTVHFKSFSIVQGDIKINLNLDRFSKQFQKAQYELDGNVMNSMVPFMPHNTGLFIDVTRAASAAIQGSGKVYAAYGPEKDEEGRGGYGRFLYEGKVMVDEETGSPWAKKSHKKIVTDRPLRYTRTHNPQVTSHWFDAAKKKDLKKWVKQAKKIAGGS